MNAYKGAKMAEFPKMPEEMLMQILARLPPKSLMRLRCVRKSWYNFINNPNFVDLHLSNSLDNKFSSSTCILFKRCVFKDTNNDSKKVLFSLHDLSYDNNGDIYDIQSVVQDLYLNVPLSIRMRHEFLDIAGHCHGIICLTDYSGNVFLSNPALKEFKLLPKSCLRLPPPKNINRMQSTGVAVGFGYNHKTKDYKVVRIVMHFEGFWIFFYPNMAEVYTMRSNSWRQIKIDIPSTVVWSPSSQMYFKGVYYWFALELDKRTLEQNKKIILSFDMDDESFDDINVPESLQETRECYGSLAVWNESVTLFSYHIENGVSNSIEIWVMDDLAKGCWTKHLTIEPVAGIGMLLTFWNSEELLMVTTDGRVVSHNFDTKKLKDLPVRGVLLERFQAVVYVYSLISVK